MAEVLGWLLYLVPVGLYVTWPPGRPVPTRLLVRAGAATAVVAAAASVVLFAVRPGEPAPAVTTGGGLSAQLLRHDGDAVLVRVTGVGGARTQVVRLTPAGSAAARRRRRRAVHARRPRPPPTGTGPSSLSVEQVARRNGGRLPFGATRTAGGRIAVSYRASDTLTVWIDRARDRVLDLQHDTTVRVAARTAGAEQALAEPYSTSRQRLPAAVVRDAARAARHDDSTLGRRSTLTAAAGWTAVLAGLGGLVAVLAGLGERRRRAGTAPSAEAAPELVRS